MTITTACTSVTCNRVCFDNCVFNVSLTYDALTYPLPAVILNTSLYIVYLWQIVENVLDEQKSEKAKRNYIQFIFIFFLIDTIF